MRLLVWLGLLACAAGVQAGRRLQLDAQCTDLSWLAEEVPEAASILRIIKALGLLPDGIPPSTTLFLPSNEATAELPAALDMPFTVDTILGAAAALGPDMLRRLNSAILYQVAPVGALDPPSLARLGLLPTALSGSSLTVREPLPGRYSLEDVNGQQADVVAGPAEATRYGCGAAVYVVDKVLLPRATLNEIPKVSAAAANLAVSGGGGGLGGGVEAESLAGYGQTAPAPAPDAAVAAAPAPAA